jgi:hypothetical protein
MRIWLLQALRSARFVLPLAAEVLLLILVYYFGDNPVADSYAATALYLVGLAAWMGLAVLDASDPVVRELAVVGRGRLRVDAARVGSALVVVAAMALLATVAPALAGAFDHAPSLGDLLEGLAAHLACGAIGVGLAACVARPVLGRAAVAASAIVAASLVLVVTGLPPMTLLDALHEDRATTGPLLAAAALALVLLAAALTLMGRRESS